MEVHNSIQFFLLKLFGFFPVTFIKSEKKFKTSFIDKAYTSICILLLAFPLSYSFWTSVKYNQSNKRYILWYSILVFAFACLSLQYFYQIIKLKRILKVFNILSQCDTTFKLIDLEPFDKRYKYYYYAILCTILSSVIIFTLSIVCIIEDYKNYMDMNLLFCWYLIYEVLLSMQFFTQAYSIWIRLLHLNNFLRYK